METKILEVEIRDVYGRPLAYPRNQVAKLFCALLKRKTMAMDDLHAIKALGYKIKQVDVEIPVWEPRAPKPAPASPMPKPEIDLGDLE